MEKLSAKQILTNTQNNLPLVKVWLKENKAKLTEAVLCGKDVDADTKDALKEVAIVIGVLEETLSAWNGE
ncbi:hypothetical protein [Endozoicomonas sp. SESOKO1]|uniref:hypothetical protein n=1 Tax=Endozoicomonas sp. SESOKO1 TaxID=2828742 RepID=UPI0021473232|nr:hypothetical protein [Endozoicomonas sp. SESOKO1]